MYWLLQTNIYREPRWEELLETLQRASIPHSVHKVVPLSGDIEPDICPPEPVIVMGSVTLAEVAQRRGWLPGGCLSPEFNYAAYLSAWGNRMLNWDAKVVPFDAVPPQDDLFFLRPLEDNKAFAGRVVDYKEYSTWRDQVVRLGHDADPRLRADTGVVYSTPKDIFREFRFWVVGRNIVTGSLYKIGDRVEYCSVPIGEEALQFAEECVALWQPRDFFMLDIAQTGDGYKIVEAGTLPCAGFYSANVGKIVESIEEWGRKL